MGPAHPLTQTQAGLLEHKQMYFCGMPPVMHAAMDSIVRQHKGNRRQDLKRFVSHVVVGPNCHDQEKLNVLRCREQFGFDVVTSKWLEACHEVRPALLPPCFLTNSDAPTCSS